MLERDAAKPLTGRVEIDDAYLGGERTGGKRGRGAEGKTPSSPRSKLPMTASRSASSSGA